MVTDQMGQQFWMGHVAHGVTACDALIYNKLPGCEMTEGLAGVEPPVKFSTPRAFYIFMPPLQGVDCLIDPLQWFLATSIVFLQ